MLNSYNPKNSGVADISAWVKDALYMDVRTNPYDIEAFVNDGIVTLDGIVDNLAAKEYAAMGRPVR